MSSIKLYKWRTKFSYMLNRIQYKPDIWRSEQESTSIRLNELKWNENSSTRLIGMINKNIRSIGQG